MSIHCEKCGAPRPTGGHPFCVKGGLCEFVARLDGPETVPVLEFVSASCQGEVCSVCGKPATNKLGEEIPFDDPNPNRHNLTAYVCQAHFEMVVMPYRVRDAALPEDFAAEQFVPGVDEGSWDFKLFLENGQFWDKYRLDYAEKYLEALRIAIAKTKARK